MSTKEQALKAIEHVEEAVGAQLAALKAHVGDQDGDGDIDLKDFAIAAQRKVGPVSRRELVFFSSGLAVCFVVMKAIALFARFFA